MSITIESPNCVPRGELNHNMTRVVRILMALHGMEQRHLANALGVDRATMSRALNGQRKWTLEDLHTLSETFDRPVSYFFESADTLVRNRCFRLDDQGFTQLSFAA